MIKELNSAMKVLDRLKEILQQNEELKRIWNEKKKIKGKLEIENYEVLFIIKEVDDGRT